MKKAMLSIGLILAVLATSAFGAGQNNAYQGSFECSAIYMDWSGATFVSAFHGFSRSGTTISTGLILGVSRFAAERFSFALAVMLTPPVIVRELLRLIKAGPSGSSYSLAIIGMICSFLAGLLALRWLTCLLERGRWHWFGYYCLLAALVVFAVARRV